MYNLHPRTLSMFLHLLIRKFDKALTYGTAHTRGHYTYECSKVISP